MTPLLIISAIVGSYLLGSIPFAYIYGKVFRKIDIREHGSGNVGATNVLRVLGTKAGLIVLVLDMLKGYLPVYLVGAYLGKLCGDYEWFLVAVGLSAILGHTFTIFLRFKGGRGVATSAGVVFAISPLTCLFAILTFILIVAVSKYVSLGSIGAALLLVISSITNYAITTYGPKPNPYETGFFIVLGIFVIYKHTANIKRLIDGTENKLSFKSKEKP